MIIISTHNINMSKKSKKIDTKNSYVEKLKKLPHKQKKQLKLRNIKI